MRDLTHDNFDIVSTRISELIRQATVIQNYCNDILKNPNSPLSDKVNEDLNKYLSAFGINARDFADQFAVTGTCARCGKPFIHRKGVLPYCDRLEGGKACCTIAWESDDSEE